MANAVQLEELAADLVADALGTFLGIVLDIDGEEKTGSPHQLLY